MTNYKTCFVPLCASTTIRTPEKLFIHVPKCPKRRKQWIELARRDADLYSYKSTLFFCGDHFDLPNDMVNYIQYKVMGYVSQIRMKSNCLPTKFECQSAAIKRRIDVTHIPAKETEMPNTSGISNTSDFMFVMDKNDCPKFQDQATQVCLEATNQLIQSRLIIARVFRFLQSEFHYMKCVNMDYDLSPFTNILGRTSAATGVSEDIVTACVKQEWAEKKEQLLKKAQKKDQDTNIVPNHVGNRIVVNKGGVQSANKTDLILVYNENSGLAESSETESESDNIANKSGREENIYRKRCKDKRSDEMFCEDQEEQNEESADETEQLVLKCEIEETEDLFESTSETPIITTARRRTAQMAPAIDPSSSTSAPSIQVIKKANQTHIEVTPTNYTSFGGGMSTVHTHKVKRRKVHQTKSSDEESLSSSHCTASGLHEVKNEPLDDE